MVLSKAEKEHILRWSEDAEDVPTFFTSKEAWARALQRKGAKLGSISTLKGKVVGWTLLLPPTWNFLPRPRRKGKPGGNTAALQKARSVRKASITDKENGGNA